MPETAVVDDVRICGGSSSKIMWNWQLTTPGNITNTYYQRTNADFIYKLGSAANVKAQGQWAYRFKTGSPRDTFTFKPTMTMEYYYEVGGKVNTFTV